jgi:TonB family protein
LDTLPPKIYAVPSEGQFQNGIEVQLFAMETDSKIYYTTDETEPTETSTLYTGPIAIERNTILRFRAVDPYGNWSGSVDAAYEINAEFPGMEAQLSVDPKNREQYQLSWEAQRDGQVSIYLGGANLSSGKELHSEPVTPNQNYVFTIARKEVEAGLDVNSDTFPFIRVYLHDNDKILATRTLPVVIEPEKPYTEANPSWGVYSETIKVALTSSPSSRIFYSIGERIAGMPKTPYSQAITVSRSSIISVQSVGSAGEKESVRDIPYVIDPEIPKLEILNGENARISPYDTIEVSWVTTKPGYYGLFLTPDPNAIMNLEPSRFADSDDTFGGTLLAKGYSFTGIPTKVKVQGIELVSGRNELAIVFVPLPPPAAIELLGMEDIQKPKVLVASVIAKLGLAEQDKTKAPELQKYETDEKNPDAINITQDNPKPEEEKEKEFAFKPEQLDKKRKVKPKGLMGLVNQDEDDERLRPKMLKDIVGNKEGSIYGTGTEMKEGNAYATNVGLALRPYFIVPSYISDQELKKLTVILIVQINEKGQVLKMEIEKRSSNEGFNTAALATIKKFMPMEGGKKTLPPPPKELQGYIKQYGLRLELNGQIFR